MTMNKVIATRDFRNAAIGSKSKGDTFSYDLDQDPEKLKKLGLVRPTKAGPLDHDEDGRDGGSKSGEESTRAKGAARKEG